MASSEACAGEHGWIFFLTAKRAAGLGLNDANVFRRQAGESYQRLVYIERTLHRTPDGQPGVAGLCDDSIGFDIKLFLGSGAVFAFDDPGSVFPCLVYISFFHPVTFKDVVFAPDDVLAALAFLDAVDGGSGRIGDVDSSYRGCQSVAVGMRQEQDRLLRMIDHAIGQAGLVIHDERNDIAAGNIFGRDNGELMPGDTFTESDRFNRSAGDGAAHRGAKDHARQREIVNVAGLPGYFGRALFAGYGDTHDPSLQKQSPPLSNRL